jgi:hypothetical protein
VPVEYRRLTRSVLDEVDRAELARVEALARTLRERLDTAEADIDKAHVHGAQSSAIQALVSRILTLELDFAEEVVVTPQDGFVSRPRPDFYFPLGDGRGVIAEVERGGTVTNNHDLKDLWKAHLAADVQHLFLVVPVSNWSGQGAARERPFMRVCNRMAAFFGEPRREVDVVSCHIFGYGQVALAPPS